VRRADTVDSVSDQSTMPVPSIPDELPRTLGALEESGWTSQPVAVELRRNAVARIRSGEQLVPTVMGYEHTVLPQLENAILAGHDVIFLGERGQAKTRMIRGLVGLLDEWMPEVAGSEIHDDPTAPVSRYARDLVEAEGPDTKINWVHRTERYAEKLATPDTAIADLIGEVDPIKVAEGRYLTDELTMHYGLVPRTNRGIFAINELPDLSERIQVGLLNVLEERDVQIRGYAVRLPLDVMLVASANPEDYTNRGRLITPLKDRFGSQIRTHYPLDVDTEVDIAQAEARDLSTDEVQITIPDHMADVVATTTHLARQSPRINQASGVSVRLTVANLEALAANATRRSLKASSDDDSETIAVAARVTDLAGLVASSSGKIEIDSLDDVDEAEVIRHLIDSAVLTVFRELVDPAHAQKIVASFDGDLVAPAGEDVTDADLVEMMEKVPELETPVTILTGGEDDTHLVASAIEFLLEGLHLSKKLNKDTSGPRALYRSRH